MARSGNRRRRTGSSSIHSHSDPQHDINITNSNNGDAIHNNGSIRHNHGIGMSGNNAVSSSAFDRLEDENHRKENKSRDGNERPRSDRRHHRSHHQHQHPAIHQRWEGKEITTHENEEGKVSKFQDYALYLASRAKELKEEGNRRFQRKDYVGAMEQYDLALELTSQDHPDRAIFHSNRAACLMQMKPVNYEEAVRECSLALNVHPGFGRALLRRARAYEALGKLDLALEDVESLLKSDMSHPDALEMEIRIRGLLGDHYHQRSDDRVPQQDLQESTPHSSSRLVQTPSSSSSQMMQTPPSSHHMVHTNADEIPLFRRMFNDPFRRQSSSATSSGCPTTETFERTVHSDYGHVSTSQVSKSFEMFTSPPVQPLKLIYDHDIRLAEMPMNCKFRDLRKIVQDKFPSAKAVLIKYKDAEGDLVTITSTKELRLAEVASAMRSQRGVGTPMQHSISNESHEKSSIGSIVIDQLRLHVVDVPPEQEPYDKEEASLVDMKEFSITAYSKGISEVTSSVEQKGDYSKEKEEHDKWLSDFADLFRVHLGIDATGGIDLHNIGIDLCSEALEEIASTEEAHKLFESAGIKFKEMIALGYLNWGNVYMCMARKELPHDTKDEEIDFCDRLQEAFDWAEAQYALAEEKFKQSLHVKPDFCDAMLSLGQKDFERAKLKWSLAIANQTDLSTWDSSKMLELFYNAEERMKMAALILDQYSREEGHDSDKGLRSHIYLLWGNILYEHSQVGYRLGLSAWKELLDASVEKFELAGAPSVDIDTALQRHLSNSALPPDVIRHESGQDEEDIVQEIIQDGNYVQESVQDDNFMRQNIKEDNDIVPEKAKIAPNDDEKGVNMEIQGTDQRGQSLKDDRNVEMEKIAYIGQLLNNDDNVEKVRNDDIELHLNTKSAESHQNEANHNMQDFANESTNGGIDLLCNGFNGRMEESTKKHIPLSNEEESMKHIPLSNEVESMKNHPQVSGNQEENLRSFEVISSNDVIGPSDKNSNNGRPSIAMVESQVSGNQEEKSKYLEEEMILNGVDKVISSNAVIELSDKNLNNSQTSVTKIQTSVKEHDVPKNLSGMDEKNHNGLIENDDIQ